MVNKRVRSGLRALPEPLDNRVLVEPAKAIESVGKIVVPETAQEQPNEGTIVAKGQNVKASLRLSVGDRVLFGKYAGTNIKHGEKTFLLMQDSELLARLPKESA